MGIRRLFAVGRYLRCRRIFRHPLNAHYHLAFVRRNCGPFDLTFKDGQVWRHQPPRRMWDFWDRVLFGRVVELPVILRDGLFEFTFEGQRKFVRPDTVDYYIFSEICEHDVYGLNELPELGTIVDLGGQVGMFASRAALKAERVITVEAYPGNFATLERNLEGSGRRDRVTVVQRAIARRSGDRLRIFTHPENSGGHSLDSSIVKSSLRGNQLEVAELKSDEVETISLDDLFAQHHIESCDYLKCDIEGGEYGAFAGASDETLGRVKRIAAELHEAAGVDDSRMLALENRLKSLGFITRRTPIENDPGKQTWSCMLFARRE